jgi:competence protein ComEA
MKRFGSLLVLLVVTLVLTVTLTSCRGGSGESNLDEMELCLLELSDGVDEDHKVDGDSLGTNELDNELDSELGVFVHVCGAVNQPGVYELGGNRRVFEAVDLAGGLREDAAVSYINLAREVEDGERIYVPNLEEILELTEGRDDIHLILDKFGGNNSSGDTLGKVSINQAGLDELMTLSGIGPSKARSIIDYREQHGRYNTIEELMNVSGIGVSTFEKIREDIIL